MGNSSSKYIPMHPEPEIRLKGGDIIIREIYDETREKGRLRYISYKNNTYFLYTDHPEFVKLSTYLTKEKPIRLICEVDKKKKANTWQIVEAGPVKVRVATRRILDLYSPKRSSSLYLLVVLAKPIRNLSGIPIELLIDISLAGEVVKGRKYSFEFSLIGAPDRYLIRKIINN